MKKLFSITVCILLLVALAVPAMAAGTTSFSMAASNSVLRRGDTVTFTVTVSGGEPATSYGLMLSYDSNVFELVNGSTTVAGTLVSSFHNGFAFMYQTPTAYSGTVGTVTLKVKDTASFGSFTVSGSASVKNGSEAIGASGCSQTVTIACDHSYGAWTAAGNAGHQRTCSVCGNVDTAAHTWNSGTVTKPASCKEAGSRTLTCTTCSASKREDIAKTGDHSYGAWAQENDTLHKHTCSVCRKEETANHTWNSGAVTKQPTCKESGIKTYTCTGCNATKTETIAKLATHTYDHACDTNCNVCGTARTTTHSYSSSWSKGKDSHWQECSVCGSKKDPAAHTPGAEATESTAQTCTVCGYVLKAALGHTHHYATMWTANREGHWYGCSGCEEKSSYAAHDFENACDPDCSICGYTRDTAHIFEEAYLSNADHHWHECSGCGEKKDAAAHEPGAAATETTAQSCTVCSYVIAPALGVEESEPLENNPVETDVAVSTVDMDDNSKNDGDNALWAAIAAAVIIIGGTVIFVVSKKKSHR